MMKEVTKAIYRKWSTPSNERRRPQLRCPTSRQVSKGNKNTSKLGWNSFHKYGTQLPVGIQQDRSTESGCPTSERRQKVFQNRSYQAKTPYSNIELQYAKLRRWEWRWVAKLVVPLLVTAALWVRNQTSRKNTYYIMGDKFKEVGNTLQNARKYTKKIQPKISFPSRSEEPLESQPMKVETTNTPSNEMEGNNLPV